ncbi:MAG: TraR/DksA family transcriptional regulator [Proteobacteria bacterium]|nr:TraR/DksA family transcriptional regulator [Pseudomonadota bacterium]
MSNKNKIDVKGFKKRLMSMRIEVKALSEATAEARQPVELDQTAVGRLSRMDALQSQAMQLETERRRTVEKIRIESALQRIDEGEFGYCVSCGIKIEPKRLDNDPTTPTCFDCAEMSEG